MARFRKQNMVGVAGFEPTTSSSRTTRATKLRYTPKVLANFLRIQYKPKTVIKSLVSVNIYAYDLS